MGEQLANCWEIKNCGRHKGGAKVAELGECIASKENLGHSCWAIAGTLCGGVVQGTAAQKEQNCMACPVYKDYNRVFGTKIALLKQAYPQEETKYSGLVKSRKQK